MFNKFLFPIAMLLMANHAMAFDLSRSTNNNECDTLITADGKIFIVHIKDASTEFILFTKCDDATQENFTIPWSQIAQLKKYKTQKTTDSLLVKPVEFDKFPVQVVKDTQVQIVCDQMVFKDGREIQVQVVSKDLLSYYYKICGDDEHVYMALMSEAKVFYATNKSAKREKHNTSGKTCLVVIALTVGAILGVILIFALLLGTF